MRRVDGVETELMTGGRGAPLLYLHAADGIEEAQPLLTRLAETFTVYAPSHPGFGGSELPRSISSVDDLAYFYLGLLEELNLQQTILVGVSLGGWIAAEIAVKNTGRLSCLVLAAPVGAKFGGRETRDIADLYSMTDKEMAACLYAEVRAPPDYTTMPVDRVTRQVRNRESFTLFGWSPTLFDPKLRQRLHRIDVPTLLLSGDRDRVVASDYGASFTQEIRGAQAQTIVDAGHYLHADRPLEVADAIGSFSKRAARPVTATA